MRTYLFIRNHENRDQGSCCSAGNCSPIRVMRHIVRAKLRFARGLAISHCDLIGEVENPLLHVRVRSQHTFKKPKGSTRSGVVESTDAERHRMRFTHNLVVFNE